MIGVSFLTRRGEDGPSEAVWKVVRDDTWTVGGMAEAGWFVKCYWTNGAPMFTRRPPSGTI